MIIGRKIDNSKIKPKLLLVNLLIFVQILESAQKTEAASCLFLNDRLGQCVKFEDCPSAVVLSTRGFNPSFCNLEEGIVCCTDSLRRTENGREVNSEIQSSYQQNWQNNFSKKNNSNINVHDILSEDNQRKKHSVAKSGQNVDLNYYIKKNNSDVDHYGFEKHDHLNSENESNKPSRRPYGVNLQGIGRDEGYFVPPGLAKKKPWRDEKTTEREYYYEHVTKKTNRGPNRKGSGKIDNNNGIDSSKSTDEDNTRKNNWSHEGGRKTTESYDFFSRPNGHEKDYSYQRNTTRGYNWQDSYSTTKQNDFSTQNNNYNNYEEDEYYNLKPSKYPNLPTQGGFSGNSNLNSPVPKPHDTNRPEYQQILWTQENNQGNSQSSSRPQTALGSKPFYNNFPNTKPQRRKRISEQKCEEYSKEITENITGLPLTTNPDPVIIPVRKCITPQQLIVGGENTTLGEFPHMAAIGFRDGNKKQIAWNCGGTLISEQYVVTAAHCASTSSGRPVKVRLGEYNLKKNDDGAHPVDYAVVEVITHPEYRRPSKYNDIALLKLSRRVTFFKHIRPACLYAEDTFSVSVAVATGWGELQYDGKKSDILQKVALSIVDNKTCNRLYKVNMKTEVLPRGIIDSQMCAGELTGGKDTCQGDSGGPLSITSTKCIHHIIGITSFGKSCALPNSTGVYTRVSAYIPWIESIVWPAD